MFQPRMLPVAIAAAILGLSGCNSNDDPDRGPSSSTYAVTITPSLGKIVNARVVLRNATTGQPIAGVAEKRTNTSGSVTFEVPKSVSAVIAEVKGGDGAKYFDEANPDANGDGTVDGADLQPLTQNLRAAAVLTGSTNIGVTALTEAAVQRLDVLNGGLDKPVRPSDIVTANETVRQAFNLGFSILQAPAVIGAINDYGKLVQASVDAASRQYAMQLASLAKLAKTTHPASATPALDMLAGLKADFSDGDLDGQAAPNVTLPASLPYNYAAFAQAWQQAALAILAQLQTYNLGFYSQLNTYIQGLQFTANGQTHGGIPQGGDPAVALRTVDGIEEYACADEGRIKSGSGITAVNIDFVNGRTSAINIYWLNNSGTRQSYRAGLASGATYGQPTYVGHPWLVTNSTGQCLGIYKPVTATQKTLTFKADNTTQIGALTGGNPDTCAGKNLPATTAATIAGFVGAYDVSINNVATTLQLAANGSISLKGQTAQVKEICGPTVLNNGTNFVIITEKKNATLFKSLANDITIEGEDFAGAGGNFYFGHKQMAATTCSSQGADDKLGFANAPSDFCGFTKAFSSALSNPDTFTFSSADADKRFVKIELNGAAVKSVQIENTPYSYACGVGALPACTGVTYTANANVKQFLFQNTVLTSTAGDNQTLTVSNGALIHQGGTTGGNTTTGGSPSFSLGTSLGGSTVMPTTGANDFKLVVLVDGAPPFGHASKIAYSGTHQGGANSLTVPAFVTKADISTFSFTMYPVNGYSVDIVGQELRVNAGGFRCNFDANKPFTIFGNSTNGVSISYRTPGDADAYCEATLSFSTNNTLNHMKLMQINNTPTAASPYSLEINFNL